MRTLPIEFRILDRLTQELGLVFCGDIIRLQCPSQQHRLFRCSHFFLCNLGLSILALGNQCVLFTISFLTAFLLSQKFPYIIKGVNAGAG